MRRHPEIVLTTGIVLLALVFVLAARSAESEHRVVGYGQIRFNGAGPERWAARYRREHAHVVALRRQLERERRIVLRHPSVVEAINLACATYGRCSTLWRKASCETGGTLDPRLANPSSSAAGLFQFLPSTWRTTPYRAFSVWDPVANALAAGWMHNVGRGGEWACG